MHILYCFKRLMFIISVYNVLLILVRVSATASMSVFGNSCYLVVSIRRRVCVCVC